MERIRDEFKKSVTTAKSAKVYLKMVSEFKLWSIMFPSILISTRFVNTSNWLVQLTQLFMANDQELYKKAKKLIPGGTMLLSKRPEMFLPEQWPSYFSKAKGCSLGS